ncbi:MAG TPA: hypothetical protein VKA45_06070, partial [Gaiellaceae bacterium]|nr:hypothetical protein [Gaiellaceae bacterium]
MRRLALLFAMAALTAIPSAAAALQPVRRDADHPRVRAGTIAIPRADRQGRVRVVVRLGQPPLAAALGSSYTGVVAQRRLNAASSSSRAYLARLAWSQAVASAAIRQAIPEARVSRSFRLLVNGLTVDLPATRLPA